MSQHTPRYLQGWWHVHAGKQPHTDRFIAGSAQLDVMQSVQTINTCCHPYVSLNCVLIRCWNSEQLAKLHDSCQGSVTVMMNGAGVFTRYLRQHATANTWSTQLTFLRCGSRPSTCSAPPAWHTSVEPTAEISSAMQVQQFQPPAV